MFRTSITTVSVALAVLPGCSSDKLNEGAPEAASLAVEELCALYLLSGANQQYGLCLEYIAPFTSESYGVSAMEYGCRPGTAARSWADDLSSAVAAGRVGVDWQKARDCLDGSRALRNNGPQRTLYTTRAAQWRALVDGTCKGFIQGKVPIGGRCEDAWDCGPGTGCYTDDPTKLPTCMTPIPTGGVCSYGVVGGALTIDWRPCALGTSCLDGICPAPLADGELCFADNDCHSGYCDPLYGDCTARPVLKGLGEACETASECEPLDGCVSCRALTAGASATCEVLGGEGDGCQTWNDCAYDLGCTNGVCTTVGESDACGPSIESLCEQDLACVPNARCDQLTSRSSCYANDACLWSPDGYCSPIIGTCIVPPDSGACAGGFMCSLSTTCVAGQCVPFATLGEACTTDGSTAPNCEYPFMCTEGFCASFCETDFDCEPGDTCNIVDGSCATPPAGACTVSADCADSEWCDVCENLATEDECGDRSECGWVDTSACEPSDPCLAYYTAGECTNPLCVWDTTPVCRPRLDCSDISDPGDCTGGCEWVTQESRCDSVCNGYASADSCNADPYCAVDAFGYCDWDCALQADQPSCEATTRACAWVPNDLCVAVTDCASLDEDGCAAAPAGACTWWDSGACAGAAEGTTYSCEPRGELGDACELDEQCLSGWCGSPDETSFDTVCVVEPYGCAAERDALFSEAVFAWGMVWIVRRRKKKR